jgi:cysteine desulfurase / selenocysteine lyase
LFVDAIQACGAVPLDVRSLHIDYLTCGGHKWLMGLEGTGFLYVHPDRVEQLRPYLAGWTSHEEAFSFLTSGPGLLRYDRPMARGVAALFEGGTKNELGFAALDAAVSALLKLGVAAIFEHVNRYLDVLEQALVERGFQSLRCAETARRSCILSVLCPAGVSLIELHRQLIQRKVICSTPDGHLRFAPHWPNSQEEIPGVIAALDEALLAVR